MNRTNKKGTFVGSIDELLSHCANMNVDKLYDECEKRESINHIMEQIDCSEQEAEQIYQELSLLQVKEELDQMIEKGYVAVIGYNDDGDPLYGLTEKGNKYIKKSR